MRGDTGMAKPPTIKEKLRRQVWWSPRGWCNVLVLVVILLCLLSLFLVYPLVHSYTQSPKPNKPAHKYEPLRPKDLPIDPDTPEDVRTRKSMDGRDYTLVFSDEFNKDGRTFFPGDDPHWEAVDLWYWATMDLEYYKPEQVTTKDGNLVITVDKTPTGTLDFRSGMLQSWNKFCFQGGLIEVSISMPFKAGISGFWPAAWTLGNLGRAGYGASTDGLWPYTYDSCDVGVMVNQTNPVLSHLPGQRLNKCVCKGDHPSPGKGRGAPEIDILEGAGGVGGALPSASQSFQVAPFDYHYQSNYDLATVYNKAKTRINTYTGGPFQQAVSGVTDLDPAWFGGEGFQTYGFDYTPGPNGNVTWFVGDKPTWSITSEVVGPNSMSGVGQRTVAEEPMYIILNLAMSEGFSPVELDKLKFPSAMYVDYVRVYQPEDKIAISCDTPEFPTREYIEAHPLAYENANITTWARTKYPTPEYSLNNRC
ncbi:hypothetical protein H4R35_001083 [Dimargaris xerosporica]|nr:hypothetical protein H4R35_001083 [Dimargaris xerosporica]